MEGPRAFPHTGPRADRPVMWGPSLSSSGAAGEGRGQRGPADPASALLRAWGVWAREAGLGCSAPALGLPSETVRMDGQMDRCAWGCRAAFAGTRAGQRSVWKVVLGQQEASR